MRIPRPIALAALCLAVGAAAAVGACKKGAPKSEVQSIGTATGLVSVVQRAQQMCGPNAAAANGNVARLFEANWRALPPRLADEFKDAKYRPLLAPDSEAQCSQIASSRGTPTTFMAACYRVEHDQQGALFPRMVLPDNALGLNSALLMTAMLSYVDFYIDSLFGPAADEAMLSGRTLSVADRQLAGFVAMFRQARKGLAAAFLEDLRSAGFETVLDKLSAEFRTSVQVLPESVDFQNYVLLHVADSYYCNPDTARELNVNFLVRTRGAFLSFVDFFGAPWFAAVAVAKN